MVLATALNWSNTATIVVSTALAFVFGYALTLQPLLRSGMTLAGAVGIAFAADTLSITTMEITDNACMLAIPGAMNAPLSSALFWVSLAASLLLAGIAAFPVNRWLIARGRGHAVVHAHHHHEAPMN
jgi:hypothetical protein